MNGKESILTLNIFSPFIAHSDLTECSIFYLAALIRIYTVRAQIIVLKNQVQLEH